MPRNPRDPSEDQERLNAVRDDFIAQWGAMGGAWGINRTMAQIHALLMISPTPLTTDDVMAELSISRGNAHMNLRELIGWGLVRSVIRKGERKEYFEGEKDVWKIFCTVVRERKRREIEPAMTALKDCMARSKDLRAPDAEGFVKQIKALHDFLEMADAVLNKIGRSEESKVLPWAMKFVK